MALVVDSIECTVYGLSRSDEPGVRYVGQTKCSIASRLAGHVRRASSGARGRRSAWIRKALREGAFIEIFPLQLRARWNIDEERWIAAFRCAGIPLLNIADGGGHFGHSASSATRARISSASKKLWSDEKYRAKQLERSKASWTPERRAAQRLRMQGSVPSAKQRKAASETLRLRYADPQKREEQTARLRAMTSNPKRIENLRAAYADPDLRRRISDRMKATWAKRKAAAAC